MALILQSKPAGGTDLNTDLRSPLKKKMSLDNQSKAGGTKKIMLIFLAENVPEVILHFNLLSIAVTDS